MMSSIEKAIETLQEIIDLCHGNTMAAWLERKQSYYMAILALKKQDPKKPKLLYKCLGGDRYGSCSDCGCAGLKRLVHDYCPRCGQRLDWR
ncbi:MAG: hypothetical protein BWY15_00443 [Firmicutes bacterium ADurb.Bin193]|nr:MAG: hypothetical protein BWY15_00443 [Firmicutes bacterium ADurb.Bin193]